MKRNKAPTFKTTIQRNKINIRHIAAAMGTSEAMIRFHLRTETEKGQMNPEFARSLQLALRTIAMAVTIEAEKSYRPYEETLLENLSAKAALVSKS